MERDYDVIVIGAGLGGLTAAAQLARAGCKTLLIERSYSVGGAASTYKSGELVIEGSLHETANPESPLDPKHAILKDIGVLNKVAWVPIDAIYEVRGGPLGVPFTLPHGFAQTREALIDRFPTLAPGITDVVAEMERITSALGTLSGGRAAFKDPVAGVSALAKLVPMASSWRQTLSERLRSAFGDNEAAKCALAANLLYWHDDPDELWWILFAAAQGGYIGAGGSFVQGGSQRLSNAIARAFRAAGGELLLHRRVSEILLDADGLPCGVAHVGKDGGEGVQVRAPVVVGNAAPSVLADMLPEPARQRFFAPYAAQALSISLFSATIGLSEAPERFGLSAYSTMLLPEWMRTLADYRRGAAIMAAPPGEAMPPLAVVNYSAIDSGLGGPLHSVSIVGADRPANWRGLDAGAYDEKRQLWLKALIAGLDRVYPGLAESVVASILNTPTSISGYLGAPEGAVYGFAPLPPSGLIWNGPRCSPRTALDRLFLASAYASSGGYTGAILGGAMAARKALRALPVSKK
ncbi:MAG: NAD(P)/FAD-dependent oxidoreductase [Hyphomicrobium sp.]|jgi:phytoene dehydrogenase-like protein